MKTVCVDFDATLARYTRYEGATKIGPPLPGARDFLIALEERGCRVLIFSCRASEGGLDAIRTWMAEHRMPHHRIWTGYGKPSALAYVDDRGVACRPQENSDAYTDALVAIDSLCAKTVGHPVVSLLGHKPAGLAVAGKRIGDIFPRRFGFCFLPNAHGEFLGLGYLEENTVMELQTRISRALEMTPCQRCGDPTPLGVSYCDDCQWANEPRR